MNLIPCDEDCINQVEGYCNLAGITGVTTTIEKDCLYYQKGSPNQNEECLPAHILESFGNRTKPNSLDFILFLAQMFHRGLGQQAFLKAHALCLMTPRLHQNKTVQIICTVSLLYRHKFVIKIKFSSKHFFRISPISRSYRFIFFNINSALFLLAGIIIY